MSDADLQKRLNDELGPLADQLQKENEAQKPAMADIANKLAAAVQAKDQALIRRHVKTLQPLVATYASLVDQANKLVAALDGIRTQDKETLKRLVPLTTKASDLKGRVMRNYEKLKVLLDDALDKANDTAHDKWLARWAEIESWMTKQREVAGIRVKQMHALLEVAQGTARDGDAKGLQQAQARAEVRKTWKPMHTEAFDRWATFVTEYRKVFGEPRDQLARDLDAFQKSTPDLAKQDTRLDNDYAAIRKVKVAPAAKAFVPDYAKWKQLLGSDAALLRKAYESNPAVPEKALDPLGRQAKPPTTGKAMVEKLRKSKLLP